jgi:N-acetylglucosaminyldiphosphoundecaprenol N-acetyl-beta-D-mannosaminyltransferase
MFMETKKIDKSWDYPNILGIRIDLVQIPDTIRYIAEWIEKRKFGNYIVVANAYDVVVGCKDAGLKDAVNASSLTVPDGFSLVLLSRFKGFKLKKRVYGPDLMLEALKFSEKSGYSSFFYGATDETLDLLIGNLKVKFPGLKIAGHYAPPFRKLSQEEDKAVVDMINNSEASIVWVGLGCPKQQLWMYEHKDKLKVPVMVGVGAAFDFFAGTKPQAPRWMGEHGFEWLFRLVTEPKRLWRRYLIDYPLFVCYLLADMVKNRSNSCKS